MRVVSLVLVLISLGMTFSGNNPAMGSERAVQRVLVLTSYHHGLECTDQAIEGVVSVFRDPKRFKVYIEYMDTKRLPYTGLEKPIFDYLAAKYASLQPDVIVVSDNNAFEFMKAHRDALFPGVAVVFCGVNNFTPAMLDGFPLATGVVENVAAKETLEAARGLQPALRRVALIVDATSTSQEVLRDVLAQTRTLDWLELDVLQGLDLAETARRVAALSPQDAVLLLPYYLDPKGRSYQPDESLAEIRAATPCPIYSLWGSEIGKGLAGGKIVDMFKAGEMAGRMALQLLDGASVADVPVQLESPNSFVFDWNELTAHGLDTQALPAEARLVNRQPRIWESYPVYFWGGVALCLALAINLVLLICNIRKTRTIARAFQHYEQRYDNIVENIIDGYYCADLGGNILMASPSCVQMFGYTRLDEVLNKNIAQTMYRTPEERRAFMERILREGRVIGFQVSMLKKDGEPIDVEANSTLVYDASGKVIGVEGVIRDITAHKRAQQELERFNRELEVLVEERASELFRRSAELEEANRRLLVLDELKTSFLTTVAHELRTPLTSVLGYTRLVQKDYSRHLAAEAIASHPNGKIQERISQNLRIIENEGQRLSRLINDFLDLSRIESGLAEWNDSECDLRGLIDQAVDAVRFQIEDKPAVNLFVYVPKDPFRLITDPDRMVQVLFNLLENAIKFTEQGSVTLTARHDPEGVEISVSDTGCGIPAENLVNLFTKFYQVAPDDLVRRGVKGPGLGLAVCREIVERYQGRIWAESVPGEGTRFVFRLPAPFGPSVLTHTPRLTAWSTPQYA